MLTASLVTGVLVSLLLAEITGLSAGGVIVPGYVALLLDRPVALAGFLIAALASFGFVRMISRYFILFGNRRFAVTILTGMTLSLGAQWALPLVASSQLEWAGLGFIVPGLLGHQFDRQGLWPSLLMLAIAAPLVRIVVLLVAQP